jgi:hypothetical protein
MEVATYELRRPRSEPEIIPPYRAPSDRAGFNRAGGPAFRHDLFSRDPFRGSRGHPHGAPRAAGETADFEPVEVWGPAPLAMHLVLLVLGVALAAMVAFVLGVVLIALPVIGMIVAVTALAAFIRGNRRPAR